MVTIPSKQSSCSHISSPHQQLPKSASWYYLCTHFYFDVSKRSKVILFGANDSCLEGAVGSQHVPLQRFKQNLSTIITYPAVQKQAPRIILVTPPPMNEYPAEENDKLKGIPAPRRKAEHTRLYAEAVKDVASQHDVALVDLWTLFMNHAGWEENSNPQAQIPGSKSLEPNSVLRMLLHDGMYFVVKASIR